MPFSEGVNFVFTYTLVVIQCMWFRFFLLMVFFLPISPITPLIPGTFTPFRSSLWTWGFRAFAETWLFCRWNVPFTVKMLHLNLVNHSVFTVECRCCIVLELESCGEFIVFFPYSFLSTGLQDPTKFFFSICSLGYLNLHCHLVVFTKKLFLLKCLLKECWKLSLYIKIRGNVVISFSFLEFGWITFSDDLIFSLCH